MACVPRELAQVLRQEHDTLWKGRHNIGEQVMLERAKLFASYRRLGFTVELSLQASRTFYSYYCDKVNDYKVS